MNLIDVLVSLALGFFLSAEKYALGLPPRSILDSPIKGVTFRGTTGQRAPSEDRPAVHYQTLRPVLGRLSGRSAADAIKRSSSRFSGSAFQNITALTPYSTQYAIEATWDDTPTLLLFDTGSSDTWAVKSDAKCVGDFGIELNQSTCQWGKNFVDDFGYGETPDIHFLSRYGSGEEISGPMGRSDITVAGITVRAQPCGLANTSHWYGNNVTNGLLGLAFPALTTAWNGPIGEEREGFRVPYSPFVTSMMSQGEIEPFFSVALDRNSSGGMLAWGGLPPVSWSSETVAYTDIIIANIHPSLEPTWQYSYYTILVDGLQWGQTTDLKKYLYIVDTGTTLMFLPPDLSEAIASAFAPPATYLFQYGAYFVPCDAIAPRMAVIIAGARFWIKPEDLIYRTMKEPRTGLCMTGMTTGGQGPYVLGAVFLQNVVAVFDVGAAQMRFYSR